MQRMTRLFTMKPLGPPPATFVKWLEDEQVHIRTAETAANLREHLSCLIWPARRNDRREQDARIEFGATTVRPPSSGPGGPWPSAVPCAPDPGPPGDLAGGLPPLPLLARPRLRRCPCAHTIPVK